GNLKMNQCGNAVMWKCTNDGIAKSQEPREKRKEEREKRG
ncbi:hypothetical protein LV92_04156, partial [Arenibacter echinorum]